MKVGIVSLDIKCHIPIQKLHGNSEAFIYKLILVTMNNDSSVSSSILRGKNFSFHCHIQTGYKAYYLLSNENRGSFTRSKGAETSSFTCTLPYAFIVCLHKHRINLPSLPDRLPTISKLKHIFEKGYKSLPKHGSTSCEPKTTKSCLFKSFHTKYFFAHIYNDWV